MKFGTIELGDGAVGAVLAHATNVGERRLRKAHVLTSDDVAMLRASGLIQVIAAVLAPDDLDENVAASRIANAMITDGVVAKPAATGRVNLHAGAAGVFTVSRAIIDAINLVDPAVTVATVADYASVVEGQMVATVKIIPFAVSANVVAAVEGICQKARIFGVSPFRRGRVGVIQTTLPGIKASVLDKTVRITEARLARSGSRLTQEQRTPHSAEAVAEALAPLARQNDMVVIFGASAMSDFEDVIPAAIAKAGGEVLRAGMPVDPGNLIVVGTLNGKPVIGAPGCARSPKENGFDWVIDRLLAGLPVGDREIAAMGVGGLLMEIPTRPQPRELPAATGRLKVEIVLLAAGRSSRMGGPNKLMALFEDSPLVRRTAERALASRAVGTIVVTGHQADRVRASLFGLDARIVVNPDFASGLSSSLKAGVAAVGEDVAGAMVLLGDMPGIATADLDRLIDAFDKSGGRQIVRASDAGKRGNPVILPRSLFAAVAQLEGDTGARHLVEADAANVIDVEVGAGASVDVDTPEAMRRAGGVLQD